VKRFYKHAAVVPAEAEGGFGVALDGKSVKTPGRETLILPTKPLADAVAAEWAAQGEKIDPFAMPMTRFANTAIDRVRRRRPIVIDEIAAYGGSDLLCYRVSSPAELAARQDEAWQPLLDWSKQRHGADLRVTRDVAHLSQDPAALAALREAVGAHSDFGLSAMHSLTAALGSLILALALSEGHIDAPEAAEASLLDELWQAAQWGNDDEAVARRESIRAEVDSAARFLSIAAA
jgi:chaperone required for assembly of F1-ATPase